MIAGFPLFKCGIRISSSAASAFACLSPARTCFCSRSEAFLKRTEIGQDQLRIDHFDVPDCIDRAAHVMNITALETANNLHDGIHLANMAEKLVAQTFSLACARDKSGDIDKLDRCRHCS